MFTQFQLYLPLWRFLLATLIPWLAMINIPTFAVAETPINIGVSTVEEQTIIAIGDIHGDIDALNEILEVSNAVDSRGNLRPNVHLILNGDLIAVGPNSPAVIKRVMELKAQANATNSKVSIVGGNHELNFLHYRFRWVSALDRIKWTEWLNMPNLEWSEAIIGALGSGLELTESAKLLREFYRSLVPFVKVDGLFLFTHSGLNERIISEPVSTMNQQFQKKMNQILDEQAQLQSSSDWLFGLEGPTLANSTADPTLANFGPDQLLSRDAIAQFLRRENVKHLVVGHWTTKNGIQDHSDYGDLILHIDTGISDPDRGQLSYLKAGPNQEVSRVQWKRNNSTLGCGTTLSTH